MNYELGFLYVFVSSSDNIDLKKIKIQFLIKGKGYYLYQMLKNISEEYFAQTDLHTGSCWGTQSTAVNSNQGIF